MLGWIILLKIMWPGLDWVKYKILKSFLEKLSFERKHETGIKVVVRSHIAYLSHPSLIAKTRKGGVGMVIRDYMGNVVGAAASPLKCCLSAEVVEAEGLLWGCQSALRIGIM